MIHRLTDNEQYRSFLDDRTGDVIIQVYSTTVYAYKEFWYEAIIRSNGRVDGGYKNPEAKQEAVNLLLGVDETSVKDADDYLRRLAKRDVRKAK